MFKVWLSRKPSFAWSMRRSCSGDASVAGFYGGRSVLVTGGTGFVGKVLIEKLLYHCKQIDKIYLLIRDVNGISSGERLSKMLTLPVFQRLREQHPQQLNKLVPVHGDITLPNLGLNSREADELINEVSVVFHAAASVKFKDTLHNLLKHNTEGTKHVVDFGKKMNKLKVLVHVSSAYSQCDKKHIEEKIYPLPIEIEKVYEVANKNSSAIENYDDSLLHGRANTYTLTKALAEDIVVKATADHGLPAIIVRPAIISPVYQDGLPGWVDSWFGATSLITTAGKGINHMVLGHKHNILDMIPVDFVTNTMIVGAAKYSGVFNKPPVYHSCTSSTNPITFKKLTRILKDCTKRQNFNALPYGVFVTDSNMLFNLGRFVSENIPAYLVDGIQKLRGRKPWYIRSLQLMEAQRDVLNVFTSNSWIMSTSKTEHLGLSLNKDERKKFPLDPKEIDWEKYMMLYLKGISEYMLQKKK